MKLGRFLAILVFVAVSAAHIYRLATGMEVVVDGQVTPMWISAVGAVVTASIAFLLYREK